MPESRARKKADYTPPPAKSAGPKTSPSWYAPVMVALFIIGLAYIVTFYVSSGNTYPVPALGRANILVGFAIIMAGFGMATRWR